MALTIKKQVTPEMLGITAEAAKRIEDAGGILELPETTQYARIGGLLFLKPRHLILSVEFWPSQEAARTRDERHNPSQQKIYIGPEPHVMQAEVTDSEGNILLPAIATPTYDELMSADVVGELKTLEDIYNAVRAKLYAWLKTWGNFIGAEDA